MKQNYVAVFEQTASNYAAYIPDLPGCVATHKTWEGIQAMIKDAIEFHIEGLQLHGDPVPAPQTSVEDALACHRSIPNDYGGHYHTPNNLEGEEPSAVLEIEVEVNLETTPATPAD